MGCGCCCPRDKFYGWQTSIILHLLTCPFTLKHQSGNFHNVLPPCVPHSTAVHSVVAAHPSLGSGATERPASLTQQAPTTGGVCVCVSVCACLCVCVCTLYMCVCMKFDGFVPSPSQGVHIETIFEPVCLNQFSELVSRNSSRSHCSCGTGLGCM